MWTFIFIFCYYFHIWDSPLFVVLVRGGHLLWLGIDAPPGTASQIHLPGMENREQAMQRNNVFVAAAAAAALLFLKLW